MNGLELRTECLVEGHRPASVFRQLFEPLLDLLGELHWFSFHSEGGAFSFASAEAAGISDADLEAVYVHSVQDSNQALLSPKLIRTLGDHILGSDKTLIGLEGTAATWIPHVNSFIELERRTVSRIGGSETFEKKLASFIEEHAEAVITFRDLTTVRFYSREPSWCDRLSDHLKRAGELNQKPVPFRWNAIL